MTLAARIKQAHKLPDRELKAKALGGCEACATVDRLRSLVFRKARRTA